jgi:hypothetical protein
MDDWKQITAKRLSTCKVCSSEIQRGELLFWSQAGGVVRCLTCDEKNSKPRAKSSGVAGKSAQTQFEKKSAKRREERVEQLGKRLGAVANLMYGDGTNATKWKKGAEGEVYIGRILDELCEKEGFYVLHDRAILKSQANIDHILITNRGVFVIDAKNYQGLVRVEQSGGILSPLIETLYVGNRKQTKLIEGVKKQVKIVESILEKANIEFPVFGALAFYDAEWPILFKPKEVDGVLINSRGIAAAVMGKAIQDASLAYVTTETLQKALKPK